MRSLLHPEKKNKYCTIKRCGIIFIDDDKYLVVKGNSGIWSFPKGRVNDNETDEECAKREVLEETGVDTSDFNIDDCPIVKIDYNIYYILHTDKDYINKIKREHTDKYEIVDIKWLSLSELEKCTCNKDIRRIIKNPKILN